MVERWWEPRRLPGFDSQLRVTFTRFNPIRPESRISPWWAALVFWGTDMVVQGTGPTQQMAEADAIDLLGTIFGPAARRANWHPGRVDEGVADGPTL